MTMADNADLTKLMNDKIEEIVGKVPERGMFTNMEIQDKAKEEDEITLTLREKDYKKLLEILREYKLARKDALYMHKTYVIEPDKNKDEEIIKGLKKDIKEVKKLLKKIRI